MDSSTRSNHMTFLDEAYAPITNPSRHRSTCLFSTGQKKPCLKLLHPQKKPVRTGDLVEPAQFSSICVWGNSAQAIEKVWTT